ncbi:AEC family transporter [Marinobacterium sp. LSUCC0821]|uniref:AEC family transporter n=1 Tax=Marinobacterium sp. LSUCC0821 TaxID=2668067 RepID=UPI0014528FF8|nr:AEC family transporter [Marinobacterium sp. LSUCC0821]QJD71270.1 AEC family transporter [Marinobacterium sp. LSUCC0821]
MTDSTVLLSLMDRVFATVFPIIAIVTVGYLYARKHAPDMAVANRINMDIFLPALIFSVMAGKNFDLYAHLDLALGSAVMVLGAGLAMKPIAGLLGVHPKTFVPPMMFNNCGNLGLPLAYLAFGDAGLSAFVVMFLVSNLMHFSLGIHIVNENAKLSSLASNPIVIATFVGLGWAVLKLPLPSWLATPIDMVGQISIPLMLFGLGVRMITVDMSNWKIGLYGAIFSPLSSLIFALPFAYIMDLSAEYTAYIVLFSVLPPAVLNYMFSERYNQEPQVVASIVLIGNIASLVIIPATLFFIL